MPALLRAKGVSGIPGNPASCRALREAPASSYPGLRTASLGASRPRHRQKRLHRLRRTSRSMPDRWNVSMPDWHRYETQPDAPYVKGRWYDPFNRNKLKGDYPIFGQRWFLNVTGRSQTGIDLRRLPVPSGLDAANPGSSGFFGRGEQAFASETLRVSLDLFRGDTSFRPVDLRFRFTPEVNLNFLQARERGIVNIDPRKGTDRFDAHLGVQEAFVEAKVHDLSPNYDFVSVRAGIQQFTSDFRGFLFSEEQPGIRVFGNLRSNRIAYNLAWFYFLEKNTNSGLNTFAEPRAAGLRRQCVRAGLSGQGLHHRIQLSLQPRRWRRAFRRQRFSGAACADRRRGEWNDSHASRSTLITWDGQATDTSVV